MCDRNSGNSKHMERRIEIYKWKQHIFQETSVVSSRLLEKDIINTHAIQYNGVVYDITWVDIFEKAMCCQPSLVL